MKQLRGLYAQTFFTFRTALVQFENEGSVSPRQVKALLETAWYTSILCQMACQMSWQGVRSNLIVSISRRDAV